MTKHRIGLVAITLVLFLVFGTLTTDYASAYEAYTIENSVHSSSNTGGQVSGGQAGSAGTPGQDGQGGLAGVSGADGKAGQDGTVVSSPAVSSIETKTVVNGEEIESISTTLSDQSDAVIATSSVVTSESKSDLLKLLISLQAVLKKYVELLL